MSLNILLKKQQLEQEKDVKTPESSPDLRDALSLEPGNNRNNTPSLSPEEKNSNDI